MHLPRRHWGNIRVTRDQVVSPIFGYSYSSIFDEKASFALDESFIKVIAWYDNEYGYTCNMLNYLGSLRADETSRFG